MTDPAHAAAAAIVRDGYGRLLALLAAADGDVAGAEDALADALERALRTWPAAGIPEQPRAWLLTVARNRQRDRWRSAAVRRTEPLQSLVQHPRAAEVMAAIDPQAIGDKRLELMLVCAHPAIGPAARTPLMLNTVLGFTAAQIARAVHVPAATMSTRLLRAKRRITQIGIPFRIPDRADLPARTTALLEAIYGAYAIAWSDAPDPRPLLPEALQLAQILVSLLPGDAEVQGLTALVLLSAARVPARFDARGELIPLPHQDPRRWDQQLISRAHEHLRAAHALGAVGRFTLEAAIQAVHCARRDGEATDWARLVPLHEGLHRIAPSHGSTVALAAAVGQGGDPERGLGLLEEVAADTRVFQPAWATRADLLVRLGRPAEAVSAYDRAIALTSSDTERTFLQARRRAVLHPPSGDDG